MKKATIHILLAWLVAILLFVLFALLGDYVRSLYGGACAELGPPRPPTSAVVAQRIAVLSVAGILYVFGAVQAVVALVRANRMQKLCALPPILFYLFIAFLLVWAVVA
jgi:hypothetical protein